MIQKIFSAIESIKRTGIITKSSSSVTVDIIVSDVMNGNVGAMEAHVVLDYLSKVSEEAMKRIKDMTINEITTTGENSSMGVMVKLEREKNYNFNEDSEWVEINRTFSIYKDALDTRQKFLQNQVTQANENKSQSPINFSTSIAIKTTPLN